jgi:RNA polymerase sigma-70 factor (ECF subfamily)
MTSFNPYPAVPDPPDDTASAAPDEAANEAARARFEAVVRAHYPRLCNFATRYVDSRETAEDIVQEVFLTIWRRDTKFDYAEPLPYLYRAVMNRAIMQLRQRRVRDRWRDRVMAVAETEGAPADTRIADDLELAELMRAVAEVVEALPERCRLIFTMSRQQDLTYDQIAEVLGISVKTVETQMGRALKALRLRLGVYLSLALAVSSVGRLLA